MIRSTADLAKATQGSDLNMTLLKATDTEIEAQKVHIDSLKTVPVKGFMQKHAYVPVKDGIYTVLTED